MNNDLKTALFFFIPFLTIILGLPGTVYISSRLDYIKFINKESLINKPVAFRVDSILPYAFYNDHLINGINSGDLGYKITISCDIPYPPQALRIVIVNNMSDCSVIAVLHPHKRTISVIRDNLYNDVIGMTWFNSPRNQQKCVLLVKHNKYRGTKYKDLYNIEKDKTISVIGFLPPNFERSS